MSMKVFGSAAPITNTEHQRAQDVNVNFMPHLSRIFDEATEKMTQVPGLPPGVYTYNPQPEQTAASLEITQVDPNALT